MTEEALTAAAALRGCSDNCFGVNNRDDCLFTRGTTSRGAQWSVLITHLTSSHLISTDPISSELGALRLVAATDNWTARDPVRRGCVRPIAAQSVRMKRGQLRRGEVM